MTTASTPAILRHLSNIKSTHIFLLGFTLILIRWPDLFISPRFWCEEGKVYFAWAWNNSFVDALFQPHLGYYTLYNNVISILATLVPLEFSPYVTTLCSMFILMVIIGFVAYGKSDFWLSNTQKLISVVFILLIMSSELWLNIINTHFLFGLIAVLILLEPAPDNILTRWYYRILLFTGAFTGVVTAFTAPVFLLKAWRNRDKEFVIQAGIVGAIAAIQLAIIIGLYLDQDVTLSEKRFIDASLVDLVRRLFRYHFYYPFALYIKDISSMLYYLVGLSAFILFLRNIYLFKNKPVLQYIFLSILLISVLSLFGSLNMRGGPRYAYAGSALITLVLIYGMLVEQHRIFKGLAVVMFSLSFLSNASGYYVPGIFQEYKKWPAWNEQVKNWRENPDASLSGWPHVGGLDWSFKLKQKPLTENP